MRKVGVWTLVLLLGPASLVRAGAPPFIPVQGYLTGSGGEAIEGEVNMRFAIYDDAATGVEIWSETQVVTTQKGLFTAYLGSQETLDLSVFKLPDDLWLGIQVGEDAEMPRIQVVSTPYSGYAEHASYIGTGGVHISANNVISAALGDSVESNEITDGTIELKDLSQDACSTGDIITWNGTAWACSQPPDNGVPSGAVMTFNLSSCPPGWSELTGARGRALVGLPASGSLAGTVGSALDDLQSREVTDLPAHSHTISPPSVSTSEAGDHGHTVSDPGHNHTYAVWEAGGSEWSPVPSVGSRVTYSTHSSTTGITVQSAAAHSHQVDAAPFESSSAGVPAVDVTMPYIQLLVCQKD